jgi:hypothetical protein
MGTRSRIDTSPAAQGCPRGLKLRVQYESHTLHDPCVGGVRTFRRGLAAAPFHGDSMVGDDIRDGDTGIFEQRDFEYIIPGRAALIEKVGEDEGTGAWAVKKIVIRCGRSYMQNDFDEIINWDDPVIELRSSNPRIQPWQLDPSGQYRVRGYLVRVLRPQDVALVPLADLISGMQNRKPRLRLSTLISGRHGWPKALRN